MRLVPLFTALAALAFVPGAHAASLPVSGTLELPGDADVTLTGDAAGSQAGFSVAAAGDVNGDGRGDFVVGAPGADARGRADAGSAFIVFGPREGLPAGLGQLGGRGIRVDGAVAGDRLGLAVAAAGDVNGDGLGDVILGAPRSRLVGADAEPGAAYVVLGRREGGAVDLAARGAGEIRLRLGAASDRLGDAVGSVPDMDGDGRPELLAGADGVNAAFVVFAKAAGGDVDLATPGDRAVRYDGPSGSRVGLSLAGTPDMNGDGRGEVLLGAPGITDPRGRAVGYAYVAFGRAGGGRVDLATLGPGGFTIGAAPADGLLGLATASVGDLTGDGVPDVAVGAPGADRNNRVNSGSLHVVAGQRGPGNVDLNAEGRPGFRIDGAAADDRLGTAAGTVPDVNGDARAELLTVAPLADAVSKESSGAGYVIFGPERPADIDLSGLGDRGYRIAGPAAGSLLGTLAGLGDIDGDNRGDIAAGASGEGAGAVHLVLGPKPPATPPPPPDPGIAAELEAGCRAITNVQVIVDDSLSMRRNDPQNLRRQAIELLITKPRNEGKVIGVFEFGSAGGQVFAPQAILPRGSSGSNQPRLLEALDSAVNGDNGGTDYNDAFKGGADDNPAAQARIFITDGGHRGSPYLDLHAGGPPTYVIGLGGASRDPVVKRRLERIAGETKGQAFIGVSAEDVIRVVNTIDSKLNCDVDIDSDEDTLSLDDPVDEQIVSLIPDARTCDIDVSWGDEDESVEPEEIAFIREGRVVARASRAQLRRVVQRPARTFSVGGIRVKGTRRGGRFGLRISGTPANRLRVRYRATKVQGSAARVTSQITQSRRRQIDQRRRRS